MFESILGRFVSYPRKRYSQDGWDLDLAVITDNIIVMSLPSTSWPETLYRNNLSQVKAFLDANHASQYKVFDFRAEGAGYSDADWNNRVSHFPFVDHHPPSFRLLPRIVDAMHEHLSSLPNATVVVHCKAGKGRSGLSVCSYLVSYQHMAESDARALFTAKRMREGFGEGVSIPSQRRYLRYVETWARKNRTYKDQNVKIESIVVTNLRSGCRLAIRGFKNDGASIETLHDFTDRSEIARRETSGGEEVFEMTPKQPVIIAADVGINLTKGNAFAHFWFNTFFEERDGTKAFTIAWQEVDGWKGTKWRGTRAYDFITVHWSLV